MAPKNEDSSLCLLQFRHEAHSAPDHLIASASLWSRCHYSSHYMWAPWGVEYCMYWMTRGPWPTKEMPELGFEARSWVHTISRPSLAFSVYLGSWPTATLPMESLTQGISSWGAIAPFVSKGTAPLRISPATGRGLLHVCVDSWAFLVSSAFPDLWDVISVR